MPDLYARLTNFSPHVLGILRIVAAYIFLLHGAQKLFSFPAPSPMGEPALLSLMGFAGVLEFFGGLLLLVGLFTRPVAFILSGQMAFAYFMAHAPQSFWPLLNGGDAAILYCFVFLFLVTAGPGRFAIDNLMGNERVRARVPDDLGSGPR